MTAPSGTQHPTSGILALIFGILGVIAVLPLVGSVLAVIFGMASRQDVAADPDRYSDEFGRIGRILGWVGLAIYGLVAISILLIALIFLGVLIGT